MGSKRGWFQGHQVFHINTDPQSRWSTDVSCCSVAAQRRAQLLDISGALLRIHLQSVQPGSSDKDTNWGRVMKRILVAQEETVVICHMFWCLCPLPSYSSLQHDGELTATADDDDLEGHRGQWMNRGRVQEVIGRGGGGGGVVYFGNPLAGGQHWTIMTS